MLYPPYRCPLFKPHIPLLLLHLARPPSLAAVTTPPRRCFYAAILLPDACDSSFCHDRRMKLNEEKTKGIWVSMFNTFLRAPSPGNVNGKKGACRKDRTSVMVGRHSVCCRILILRRRPYAIHGMMKMMISELSPGRALVHRAVSPHLSSSCSKDFGRK